MTYLDEARISEELGLDYATWLLWHSKKANGKLELSPELTCELFVLGPVTLVSSYGDSTSVTLQGENPAGSPETAKALSEGKYLAKATFKLIYESQSYDFAFNALTFGFSSLKLPPLDKGAIQDTVLIRLDGYQRFIEFWDLLFEHFLSLRMDEKRWKEETRKIRQWIKRITGVVEGATS
jgi:hypothetical protein